MCRSVRCFLAQIIVVALMARSTVGEETLVGKTVLPRIGCKVLSGGEVSSAEHFSLPFTVLAQNKHTLTTDEGMVNIDDVVTIEEALEYYKSVIESDSRSAEAFRCRAFVFCHNQKYERALDDIVKAQKLEPTNATYVKNHGDILYFMKKPDEALERYRKAINLRPDYFHAYINCGAMLVRQSRHNEAAEFLFKAVELKPSSPEAWMFLGLSHGKLGRSDRGIAEMSRAIALKDSPECRYCRCHLYLKNESYEELLSDTEHLIRRKAELDFAYTARARGLFHLGRSKEALNQLDDAISQGLTDSMALGERAKLWASLGEYEKQLQDLTLWAEERPQEARAHMALSQFLSTTTCDAKRDGGLAYKHANLAINLSEGVNLIPNDILAAAKAELQEFDEAERLQKKAIRATKEQFIRLLEGRCELIDRISAEVDASEAGRDEWTRTFEKVEAACRLSEWRNPGQIDRLSILAAEMGDAENAKKLQHLRHKAIEDSVLKDMEALRVKYENHMPARIDTGNFIDGSGRLEAMLDVLLLSR
ncbi:MULTISPECIES: tetratricopeptide repeat protein [unclassified Schlesneria]|uniref:tetratricopeptide repeat protein n=1 Tax=unclassified Schlesneria TaxID=2762017 RepID=UPI002EF0F575